VPGFFRGLFSKFNKIESVRIYKLIGLFADSFRRHQVGSMTERTSNDLKRDQFRLISNFRKVETTFNPIKESDTFLDQKTKAPE